MTLDEAIKHAEEVAKQNEEKRCCKCAEEHRQLAEWLKELKQLREQTRWTPCSKKPPEPFKLVLIQDSCGGYEISKYIPPRIKPKNHPNGYWGETNGVDYDYFDIVAWHSLPKKYHLEGEKK